MEKELHNEFILFYASHNIIRPIKSRLMRWAWHVALGGSRYSQYLTFLSLIVTILGVLKVAE